LKKNIIYLLLFVAIAFSVYWFVIKPGSSTLNTYERNFAIEDTASIGKIFIANMGGLKNTLQRQGNQWTLNNTSMASKEIVNLILSTLKRMEVRYPVSGKELNTVIKEMAGENKKVEVYNKKGDLIRAFYVGGVPTDNIGNFMLIEGSKTPFVVSIPGFVGTLETRFAVRENDLKKRAVIEIPFQSLAQIDVNYMSTPDSSFSINVESRDSFKVFNSKNKISIAVSKQNKQRLFDYIDFLKQVNCEAFENERSNKENILKKGSFATITIRKRNNEVLSVDLYRKDVDRSTTQQFDNKGNAMLFDSDRFYGLINNKDFVLLQDYHFGKLLRSINYFRN
jgi:hypothetical protein